MRKPSYLSLPMVGLEEPYLCIKMIFVSVSLVLWLVLGFGWKFRVKIGKPTEIAGEYEALFFLLKTYSFKHISYTYF